MSHKTAVPAGCAHGRATRPSETSDSTLTRCIEKLNTTATVVLHKCKQNWGTLAVITTVTRTTHITAEKPSKSDSEVAL